MVVFRLTQEEYDSLREACKSKGGRNLSEFTRSELLAMLRSESISALIQNHFYELEQKLAQVQSAVGQLTDRLACGAPTLAEPSPGRIPGTDQL